LIELIPYTVLAALDITAAGAASVLCVQLLVAGGHVKHLMTFAHTPFRVHSTYHTCFYVLHWNALLLLGMTLLCDEIIFTRMSANDLVFLVCHLIRYFPRPVFSWSCVFSCLAGLRHHADT